jgi:ParB family chromosome partitioning protein
MSKERRALGRGLSALISQTNLIEVEANENPTAGRQIIHNLSITNIFPNKNQPRKQFSHEEISELANSIKEHGILQPILVNSLGNNEYEIIAGERRWQAAQRAGLTQVPAIIKNVSEIESFEYAIIENIQRQDLNPHEEALAYQRLIEAYGYTHEQLAKKLSKSRSHISNCLRVLTLPSDVQSLMKDNKLSFSHARALVNSENPSELATKIVEENLSVRAIEGLVKNKPIQQKVVLPIPLQANQSDKPIQEEKNYDIIAIEHMLSNSLNLLVKIVGTEAGGQLQIHFKTLQDLDNLIQLLGSKGLNF